MIEQLMQRIKLLFGVGTTTRMETKTAQILFATGVSNDRIKRVHNYGFMSRPLPESRAYTLFVGGDTSRGIAVCIEDERYEMELEPGEIAILDDKQNLVHFTSKGILLKTPAEALVQCATAKVEASETVKVESPDISFNEGKPVVTCGHVCLFTGTPHTDGSSTVRAGA